VCCCPQLTAGLRLRAFVVDTTVPLILSVSGSVTFGSSGLVSISGYGFPGVDAGVPAPTINIGPSATGTSCTKVNQYTDTFLTCDTPPLQFGYNAFQMRMFTNFEGAYVDSPSSAPAALLYVAPRGNIYQIAPPGTVSDPPGAITLVSSRHASSNFNCLSGPMLLLIALFLLCTGSL
jgi:hypothetical protein